MTPDISGILNIDKPAGCTSYRVVQRVRRRSGVGKVGHAGSLDPLATGVLLICLGQATRLSQYLMELPKTYRAEIALGVATDTYDAEGQPTFRGDPSLVSEAGLKQALKAFRGESQQVPPPYSAVKRQGRPAYAYARAGQAVALSPRKVMIYRIDLLAYEPPLVTLQVDCGKGTYLRSLAHDLGQRLGCGAHLQGLVRLSIGPFSLADASSLEAVEAAFTGSHWQELLLPLDYGLGHLPAIALDMEAEREVRHGRPLPTAAGALAGLEKAVQGQRCRAYGGDGSLVAVLRFEANEGMWRPEKVFTSPQQAGV